LLAIPLPLGEHNNFLPEKLRKLKDRIRILTPDTVPVAHSLFSDDYEPVDDVVHVGEDALLRPRGDHTEREPAPILLFENGDHRPHSARAFVRSIYIIEIRNGVGDAKPLAVILHELGHTRLAPRIRTLITPKAAVCEFR
jgi:hypothetical protein